MSDRPTGANGKRNQAWGTTSSCPVCGQCLCFGCHPSGPCLDEQDEGRPRHRAGARPAYSFNSLREVPSNGWLMGGRDAAS